MLFEVSVLDNDIKSEIIPDAVDSWPAPDPAIWNSPSKSVSICIPFLTPFKLAKFEEDFNKVGWLLN